jgi:hypothetical protein
VAELDTEDAGYDLLLCIDVFEHVEDYSGFFEADRNAVAVFRFSYTAGHERQVVVAQASCDGTGESNDTAVYRLPDAGYETTRIRF